MDTCSHCSEVLTSPLACGGCESLFPVDGPLSPFEVFGLKPSARIDSSTLRKRLIEQQCLMHPDFHGAAGAKLQGIAEHNTAELNAAFEFLRDEAKRASFIVQYLGGPSESEDRQMPQAFLMEVMEWNESLEELRGKGPKDPEVLIALTDFRAQLNLERARLLEATLDSLEVELARDLHGRETLSTLRRDLNAIRYIDRALSEVASITLAAEVAGQSN